MRILVTGSRHGWDPEQLLAALDALVTDIVDSGSYIHGVDEPLTLVHGAAPGVDAQAARLWEAQGWGPTESHPANWAEFGRRAGPLRNKEMVESGINVCIAFLDDDSKGTKNCIAQAEAAGIPVFVNRRNDGSAR